MPAQTSCPVPEVDKRLSKYIYSQHETRKIRSKLSRYFALHTRLAKSQSDYRHLDNECPTGRPVANRKPQELSGVRLRYLRALEAHAEAQSQHRKLQDSVGPQWKRQLLATASQSESDHDNEVIRGYVSLLRQRQRFAELQVISEGVEKLLNTNPIDARHDPKAMVKHNVGEQPDLPAERLDILSQESKGNDQIFKLKKEVVDARARMDRAMSARNSARNIPRTSPTLDQQVHALGCARDEIQEWLEEELAKLTEESELLEDASPVKQLRTGTTQPDLDSSESRIKASYNQYIAAREEVIRAQGLLQRASESFTPSLYQSRLQEGFNKVPLALKPTSLAASILAYQPNLAQTSRNERILLQQIVYLQSQISTVDEDVADSLTRLSQESHLLASGSKEPGSWGKIAKEAERSTGDVAEAQLKESRSEVENVRGIVDLCSLHGKVLSSMTR